SLHPAGGSLPARGGAAPHAVHRRLLGLARSGPRPPFPGFNAAHLHRVRLALYQPAALRPGHHRLPGRRASRAPAGDGGVKFYTVPPSPDQIATHGTAPLRPYSPEVPLIPRFLAALDRRRPL